MHTTQPKVTGTATNAAPPLTPEQLDRFGKLFESLDGEVRSAAYLMLYHARRKFREPITTDKN